MLIFLCNCAGLEGEGKDEWVNMDLDEAEDSDDQEDDQMGFVHKQPLVATGMAATLALLKGSGQSQIPSTYLNDTLFVMIYCTRLRCSGDFPALQMASEPLSSSSRLSFS